MKKSFLVILIALSSACTKEKSNNSVTVIKDCTGTYLRDNNKDYQVCNISSVASFNDGDVVSASYYQTSSCSDTSQYVIVCMMYHENEGYIYVTSIK